MLLSPSYLHTVPGCRSGDLAWELMLTFSHPWLQIGTPSASVSKEIADVQRLLKPYEGKVTYTMHSAGTTVGANLILSA